MLTHEDQGNQELNIQDCLFKQRYRTWPGPKLANVQNLFLWKMSHVVNL